MRILFNTLLGLCLMLAGCSETHTDNEADVPADTLSVLTDTTSAQKEVLKDTIVPEKISFEEYTSYFKEKVLPLSFSSETMEERHPVQPLDESVANRYTSGRPLYSLKNKQGFVLLISSVPADIAAPALSVYTTEGVKTDSVLLFKQPGGDEGYSRKEEVEIKKDLSIEAKYTIEYYQIDKEGNVHKKSNKKEVIKEKYQINDKGKIVKM